MKNIFKTLLSLFGFGNKNKEAQKPQSTGHPSNMNYWEARSLINTTTIREYLLNAQPDNSSNSIYPIKYDITQLGECDFSIDTNLILPYRSQTDKVQQLLLWNTIISNNEARKVGLTRLPKIVSELRKKAWSIKTYIIFKNGKKQDVIYVLMDNSDEMLGAETYVVK